MNITLPSAVIEQALKALENLPALSWIPEQERTVFEAITALRTALEQPEQEPVAWKDRTYGNLHHQDFGNSIPLYTAPPQRKPLTDDLYNELLFAVGNKYPNETRHQTALRYILQAEKSDAKAAHGIREESNT